MKFSEIEWPNIRVPVSVVFFVAFFLALVFYFPVQRLSARVSELVRDQTGLDIRIHDLRIGTGIGSKGGLLALRASELVVPVGDTDLSCKPAVVSLNLIPLLSGKGRVTIGCSLAKAGEVVVSITKPIFSKTAPMGLDVDLDAVNLGEIGKLFSLSTNGILSGTVALDGFDPRGNFNQATWSLKGKDIATPPSTNPLMLLPALKLGDLSTAGKYDRRKLQLESFRFGDSKASMEGQFNGTMSLDASQGPFFPVGGELLGSLRVDPAFEKNVLSSKLNLDLVFGKVNPSGKREFKKVVNGSPISLLMDPPVQSTP